jgi:hypothetical protein
VIAPGKGGATGGGAPQYPVYWTGAAVPRKYATANLTIKTTIPPPQKAQAVEDPSAKGQPALEGAPQPVPNSAQPAKQAPPAPPGAGGPPDAEMQPAPAPKKQVPQPRPGPDSNANVSTSADQGANAAVPAAPDSPAGGAAGAVAMPDYTIIDESKSYWDVSIAVPVKKVSALQYSSTNNSVTTSQVNKNNVFAVVDLYFPPKDLVGMNYSFIPHPLLGVSMASKPLQSLLFGGAIGLSFGELYVGANLIKQQQVSGLTAGSTATPQQLAAATSKGFQAHFTIGINISVKSAFNAAANGSK